MHLEDYRAVAGFKTIRLNKRNTCSVRSGQCLVTGPSAENRSHTGVQQVYLKADPLKSLSERECLSMWAEIMQHEQKSGDTKKKPRGNIVLGWHSISVKPYWSLFSKAGWGQILSWYQCVSLPLQLQESCICMWHENLGGFLNSEIMNCSCFLNQNLMKMLC